MHDIECRSAGTTERLWHSNESSLREKMIEHVFTGELLRCLWRLRCRDIEILKAEVDRGGYDVVIEANGVVRHIQLKSSYLGSKTAEVAVHLNLLRKPSGCVVWIQFDPETMELGPYLWLGAGPGLPLAGLGDKIARHSKGNRDGHKAQRPNLRIVRKSRFTLVPTAVDLARALFALDADR